MRGRRCDCWETVVERTLHSSGRGVRSEWARSFGETRDSGGGGEGVCQATRLESSKHAYQHGPIQLSTDSISTGRARLLWTTDMHVQSDGHSVEPLQLSARSNHSPSSVVCKSFLSMFPAPIPFFRRLSYSSNARLIDHLITMSHRILWLLRFREGPPSKTQHFWKLLPHNQNT
jgi:hypothetical protein